MGVNIVRKPSETPNITIPDDCRMFRYAMGGYNGYVLNYLEECNYTVSGRNFTVKSGELLVDGYQVDIDLSGAQITAISSPATFYYVVYLELDLQQSESPSATVKALYSLASYPSVDLGEDLTTNPNGVRRLVLYKFLVTNGEISSVTKVVPSCAYASTRFKAISDHIVEMDNTISRLEFDVDDINSRLDELGFSEATAPIYVSISPAGSGYDVEVGTAYFYRLGRFVICRLDSTISSSYLPALTMPYMRIPMSNSLKSFVRSVNGTLGTHTVNQIATHTIGGRGTISAVDGNDQGARLINCYDKVSITSDDTAVNFLTSAGAKYDTDNTGFHKAEITMKQFDVALGWLCVNPES